MTMARAKRMTQVNWEALVFHGEIRWGEPVTKSPAPPRLRTHAGAAKNKRPDRGRSLCEGNRSRDRRSKGVGGLCSSGDLGERLALDPSE